LPPLLGSIPDEKQGGKKGEKRERRASSYKARLSGGGQVSAEVSLIGILKTSRSTPVRDPIEREKKEKKERGRRKRESA